MLEGVAVDLGPWVWSAPSLVVGVEWSALWRGELEAVVTAARFRLGVDAVDGPEALLVLSREIEKLRPPPVSLALRGGTVETRDGQPLLVDVALDVARLSPGVRLRLDARQDDGGHLNLHGGTDPAAAEAFRVDVYLDGFASHDLRRWLTLATRVEEGRLAGQALPAAVTGRWHVRLGRDRAAEHRFDLEVSSRHGGPEQATGGLEARATGNLAIGPPAAAAGALPGPSDPRGAPLSGSLRIGGRIERLHTFLGLHTPERRLLISGPVGASLSFDGSTDSPRVAASIELGETYLGLGSWLQKAPGTTARLELRNASTSSGRTLEVSGRVGELRAVARLGDDGALAVRSGWLPAGSLVALCPELEGRLHAGRLRAIARRPTAGPLGARIDLAQVELGVSNAPEPRLTLSGSGRLEGRRLAAHALRAEVGGAPFLLDLGAELANGERGRRLLVRFAARAKQLELTGSSFRASALEGSSGILPGPLRAVAQTSVSLLRRERSLIEHVELEQGRIEAGRVHASGETLRDLRVELGLADLRLEVRRFAFRRRGVLHEVRGFVDLDELIPEFVLAGEGRP